MQEHDFICSLEISHPSYQTASNFAVYGTVVSFSENYYRSEKKQDIITKLKCEEAGPIYELGSEKS